MGKMSRHPKTIAIDFDGVIADYSTGFQGRGECLVRYYQILKRQ